jgi:drug/metabolite transporter (DMT)-like permease
MPATALMLVVLAAVLHAVWNIVAKKAGGDDRFVLVCGVFTALVWLPAGLWFGVQELPRWGWAEWGLVWASALVHLLYFRCLLKGYRVGDLTVVYPLARGSGPLVVALVAVLFLGERLSLAATLGVLAVCGGVFLIAGGTALFKRGLRSPEQQTRMLAGVRWGLLTGVLIAGYTLIDGIAIKFFALGPVLYDYLCNLLRLPFQAPLWWRDPAGVRQTFRSHWRAALVVATLGPAAYIAVLYALQIAPLSHVAPARELSLLVAALIGGRLLGEGDRALRLLGAACIAGGVMALAWR